MKFRNGFVSNSSSSSFVVIGKEVSSNTKLPNDYVVGASGECEFGWDFVKYDDIDDRINFAYIQAGCKDDWMYMLEELLKAHGVQEFESRITNEWDCEGDEVYGYIDHQSAACEGENTEIFDSPEILERFIFCVDSFIQGGNDNQ